MNDIAYTVKKSNTARFILIITLSLLMAFLIGSGLRNQSGATVTRPASSSPLSGINNPALVAPQGIKLAALDRALRSMSTIARAKLDNPVAGPADAKSAAPGTSVETNTVTTVQKENNPASKAVNAPAPTGNK